MINPQNPEQTTPKPTWENHNCCLANACPKVSDWSGLLYQKINKAKEEGRAEVLDEVIQAIEEAKINIIGLDQKKADILHAMNFMKKFMRLSKKNSFIN